MPSPALWRAITNTKQEKEGNPQMQRKSVGRRDADRRRVLRRRLLFFLLALVALVGAYGLLNAVVRLSPASHDSAAKLPEPAGACECMQMSTRNASLERRADPSLDIPTTLEARVADVLQRRWPHTAGAAAALTRPLRVRVATVANRTDFTTCAEQASAVAGGVNVSLVGFAQPYSHVGRLQTLLDFAEKEGLAGEDVVMLVDSDVLWTGLGLEDAVAKFVAYSPPSQASLWPAAVRAWEDYGEHVGERFLRHLVGNSTSRPAETPLLQLPPVLFSAERYCHWNQKLPRLPMCRLSFALVDYITDLVRNGYSNTTPVEVAHHFRVKAPVARFALESVQEFLVAHSIDVGRTSTLHRTRSDPFYFRSNMFGERNVVRYLNGGGMLIRVWALRVYAAVFRGFVATYTPIPTMGQENRGWKCDQSIHGSLYTRGRMFEAARGLLDALPDVTAAVATVAAAPYGLPPGMMGLDRRSEFFFVVAGVLMRKHRNYVGTEYYQRNAGPLVFRLLWYLRRLRTWWLPEESVSAVRRGPASTANGCALTPLLLRRRLYREDVARGYRAMRDDDAEVAVAPVVHIPGNDKEEKYAKILRYMPWYVAARWSRTANDTLFRALGGAEIEVWGPDQRHYIPFSRMCKSTLFLV